MALAPKLLWPQKLLRCRLDAALRDRVFAELNFVLGRYDNLTTVQIVELLANYLAANVATRLHPSQYEQARAICRQAFAATVQDVWPAPEPTTSQRS